MFQDEDDDFDEEDAEDEEEDGWQAEEGTKAPETLTEFKWKHYGTRGGVEESRKNHPDVMNQGGGKFFSHFDYFFSYSHT